MKKLLVLILVIITAFVSCSKDDTFITEEIYVSSEPDLKAYQMQQISLLFDNVARQPEMSEGLINATKAMLYEKFEDLLPISDTLVEERGIARGIAFSAMFAGMARQPEYINVLDSIATIFLGVHNDTYISKEMLNFTKTFAAPGLIEGLGRQPEMYNSMDAICKKYFNCNLKEIVQ